MSVVTEAETRTLLDGICWETYCALAEERSGSVPRITFDRGLMELMNPRKQHENIGCLIGRMVETYTEVRGIEIESVASTTFKSRELERGFEADEAYYITHAEQIRSKEDVDLAIDPPPDLVIEIEITSSAIEKKQLFAAMGIPEFWRHDGDQLWMYRLAGDQYEEITSSVELPGFTRAMVIDFLSQRGKQGETTLIRQFRASIG